MKQPVPETTGGMLECSSVVWSLECFLTGKGRWLRRSEIFVPLTPPPQIIGGRYSWIRAFIRFYCCTGLPGPRTTIWQVFCSILTICCSVISISHWFSHQFNFASVCTINGTATDSILAGMSWPIPQWRHPPAQTGSNNVVMILTMFLRRIFSRLSFVLGLYCPIQFIPVNHGGFVCLLLQYISSPAYGCINRTVHVCWKIVSRGRSRHASLPVWRAEQGVFLHNWIPENTDTCQ